MPLARGAPYAVLMLLADQLPTALGNCNHGASLNRGWAGR